LADPQEYFDKPETPEQLGALAKHSALLTAIIHAKTEADENARDLDA
jgi:hypothetical protein